MADVIIQLGYKDSAWFTANASLVLAEGQKVHLLQTGTYKLGDGVTQLSALSFLGASGAVAHNDTTGKQGGTTNEYYHLTSAQHTVVQNTSGTNTGDDATNSTSNTYADSKVADAINDGTTTIAPSQNAVFDALALKAPLASPTFTGNPQAPTPATNDNDQSIATTEFVQNQIAVSGVSNRLFNYYNFI